MLLINKVIVERLPKAPAKPADLIIERWLGYPPRMRNVKLIKNASNPPRPAPKNVLIEWDAPEVCVKQQFKCLGIRLIDPVKYAQRHGLTLVDATELPREVSRFKTPAGEVLAVNCKSNDEVPFLKGCISALKKINLNCHGLNEYASQL